MPQFLQEVSKCSNLQVRGLMTLAKFSSDIAKVRACFIKLRTLRDEPQPEAPATVSLQELSIGMSADCELAIANRFYGGARRSSDFRRSRSAASHYWPSA